MSVTEIVPDEEVLRAERRVRALQEMEAADVDILVLGREANARYVSGAPRLWTAGSRAFGPGCVVVRATGAVMPPLIILSVTMLLIRYPVARVFMNDWPDAIWWSFPFSSAIAAALAISYYKWGGWRQAQMLSKPLSAPAEPA